jgi:hypothetical protein
MSELENDRGVPPQTLIGDKTTPDGLFCHMKILIQNCQTHLYFKSLSEWTPDAEEARNFKSSDQAIKLCAEHRIPAVQIVLKFENNAFDVPIPITEECGKTPGVVEMHSDGGSWS